MHPRRRTGLLNIITYCYILSYRWYDWFLKDRGRLNARVVTRLLRGLGKIAFLGCAMEMQIKKRRGKLERNQPKKKSMGKCFPPSPSSRSCVWNICCAKEATSLLLTNQITWLASMLENAIWFSLFSASLNRMLSSQSLPFFPNADRSLYLLYLSLTRGEVLQAIFLPYPYHSILHPSYRYGETVLILFTIHITFQWWK